MLDKAGRPLDIKPYERNTATKIIEDFMLAANETVAEDYFWQQIPFVYRTHDTPDKDKLTNLLLLSIISDIQSRFPMMKSIRKNCRSSWKD